MYVIFKNWFFALLVVDCPLEIFYFGVVYIDRQRNARFNLKIHTVSCWTRFSRETSEISWLSDSLFVVSRSSVMQP